MRSLNFDNTRIAQFVAERIGVKPLLQNFQAIGLEENGKLIAGALYYDYNCRSITAAIAGDGNWNSRWFLRVLFDYPFNQLKVKRLSANTEHDNYSAQRFLEKSGFELEAVLEEAGRNGDLFVYKMFKQNCRWIGDKK